MAERPRTVRITLDASAGAPLYSVEWRDLGGSAMDGASVGILLGGLVFGGMNDSCDGGCAKVGAAMIGGGAVIGGIIGVVTAPARTLPGRPLEDFEATRSLVAVLERTRRDIIRRAAEMLAENLRREGGHEVSVVAAAPPWYEPVDSEIMMTASAIGLVGPEPDTRGRARLQIMVEVRAQWLGSAQTQRFHYESEVVDLSDWADSDTEAAGHAARLAFANLSGQMFTALAEP